MNTLYKRLREFKLSGIVSNLEERLTFASQNQIGYSEMKWTRPIYQTASSMRHN